MTWKLRCFKDDFAMNLSLGQIVEKFLVPEDEEDRSPEPEKGDNPVGSLRLGCAKVLAQSACLKAASRIQAAVPPSGEG